MKQVQIDGLVSGDPSLQAHVGSVVPSPVPPEALPGSLPFGLGEVGRRFLPKILLFQLRFLLGDSSRLLCHLTEELRVEEGDRG